MARVHFVEKALKDNPVAKKGESYYWWKPRVGGRGGAKRYSKNRPRASQTTSSEYLSTAYAIQESIEDTLNAIGKGKDATEWKQELENFKSELESQADEARTLGEETQDKFDNMPESLQQGETGQLLESRVQACEETADELERAAEDIDLDADPEEEESFLDLYRRLAQDVYDQIGWNWGD